MDKLKDLITEDQELPTFYMMVGVPGSGKSTTIKKIQSTSPNAVVICPDEYRKALGGSYSYFKEEPKIWNQMCPNDTNEVLADNQDVIFDATNVAPKRRKAVLKWLKVPARKVAVVVEVPLGTALKQNKMREPDKIVPDHVITNMFKSFVYPTESEGFDKVVDANKI
jgi:predicted kinase